MSAGIKSPSKSDELATLQRYRIKLQLYRQWLGEFPEIAHVLDTLHAAVEGKEGLNAGTPYGMEYCTVDGLREQLRKMKLDATKPQPDQPAQEDK